MVPIPKPKECCSKPLICDDFRGIAISPIISKVFEHCILRLARFGSFFDTADNQFGCKKGIGCNFSIRVVRKSKGNPYSITERRVPELIPVVGSQPAGE